MNKILALLLLSMMPLFCAQAAFSATAKSRPAPESAWQLAAEAYVYALPLVLTDATRRVSTNPDGRRPTSSITPRNSLTPPSGPW